MKVGACLASILAALVFVGHGYGPAQVASAAGSANLELLGGAVGLGLLLQIVRAQRCRSLLAQNRSVSLPHSFAAMVVGHGIGDLLPLAPGGPVLRSVLTERLAGVPVAFSGGAYMIEGTLDVITPALLIPYVLSTLTVPAWAHWVLLGIAVQAMLLLTLMVVLAVQSPAHIRRWLPSRLSPRLVHLACQVADGLRAMTSGGLRRCLLVCGESVLVLALTAAQLTLLLQAFGLHAPMSGVLLLLVVMLSAGSIPLKIPAFGTMSVAAALPVAGILNSSVGGYLLVSQFLLSSQTVALALLVLGWWFIRGSGPLANPLRATSEQPAHARGLETARSCQDTV